MSHSRRGAGGVAADGSDGPADAARDIAARSDGRPTGHRFSGRRRRLPDLRQDRNRAADQPGCGCYYDNVYWITFAGMAPTDDPRYVIGIMADNPQRTADGQRGTTMAPLFHNIAAWLLQRENVPLSPDPGPPLTLQAT